MKNHGNRYRSHNRDTVKQLEQKLSFGQRLFSVVAFLRGAKKLRSWIIIIAAIFVGVMILNSVFRYTVASYGTQAHHIHYGSQYEIISKEQIVNMLGISKDTDFASLPITELNKKLNNHPAIKEANIFLDSTLSLNINIVEHLPLLYVEMADRAVSGKTTRLCLSPEGEMFAYDPEFHKNFVDLPVWLLNPGDVETLAEGKTLDPELCQPVIKLAQTANSYDDLTQLPHIVTIERPSGNTKQWKMILRLENGATVEMSALHDIPAQVNRLVLVLEHARLMNKKLISTSVVPEEYVPAVYEE